MNVERLNVILQKTIEAVTKSDLVNQFGQLVDALQNQVNDPANATYQEQVGSYLVKVRNILDNMETNTFAPGWLQVLDDYQAGLFVGTEFRRELDLVFSENAITPTLALKRIQEMQSDLKADVQAFTEITNGMKRFGFQSDELEPGEAELGLLVPRIAIDSRLDRFTRELADIGKIVGVFEEITTGQRREPVIRALSSSDLTVLLDIWPVSGAALAAAVERIAAFYKQVLEIKKLKLEVTKLGITDRVSKELDKDANDKMEANLKSLKDEIIKDYVGTDKPRRHELDNELLIALNKIANKIDQGIYFEFRAGEPTAAPDETEDSDQKALRSHTASINQIGRRLALIEPVEGRILQLPEIDRDEGQRTTQPRKKD